MEINIYEAENTRAISNSSFSYDINDNFKVKSIFSIDFNLGNDHRYQNPIEGDGVGENGELINKVEDLHGRLLATIEYKQTFGDNEHFVSCYFKTVLPKK